MLLLAKSLSQLSFDRLMQVYLEGNRENGRSIAPEEPEARQIALAEQDFFGYLHDTFFAIPDSFYCIWEENGEYVSALRLEPYRDGWLLEALETAPEQRRRGYAVQLVQEALKQVGETNVYSHVSKRNVASLKTHQRCGFQIIQDCACYLDGSVNFRAFTLCCKNFEKKKNRG